VRSRNRKMGAPHKFQRKKKENMRVNAVGESLKGKNGIGPLEKGDGCGGIPRIGGGSQKTLKVNRRREGLKVSKNSLTPDNLPRSLAWEVKDPTNGRKE